MKTRIYQLVRGITPLVIFLSVFVAPSELKSLRTFEGIWGSPPALTGGDEPHYLILINSLVRDKDLDLKNNYFSCAQGQDDCGRFYAGTFLGPHVVWNFDGRQVTWLQAVNIRKDSEGTTIEFKPEFRELARRPYISWHPYTFGFLLAAPAAALNSWWSEESIVLTVLAALGATSWFLLLRIFQYLGYGPWHSWLGASLIIMATPWWHYTRVLFTEGMIAFLLTLALYTWVKARAQAKSTLAAPLLIGCCFGLAMLLKNPVILAALPFVWLWLKQKQVKQFLAFSAPCAVALATYFALNTILYGAPLNLNAKPYLISMDDAMWAMFLSLNQGIAWSLPIFFVSLTGFVFLFKRDRALFTVTAGPTLIYFIFLALVHNWYGGAQYGPRFMVPILPFIGVAAIWLMHEVWRTRRWLNRTLLVAVFAYALVINSYAGVMAMQVGFRHPLNVFFPDRFEMDFVKKEFGEGVEGY